MQEHVGFLIAAARRRMKQAVVARISDRHLSPQQFWMLVGLAEHPGVCQAALAERVRADAPTISRTLSTLVERRLARTAVDPADRRRTRVYLTATGERLAAELVPIATEIRDALIDGMTPADVTALRSALHRVLDNLDRLDVDEPQHRAQQDVRPARRERA